MNRSGEWFGAQALNSVRHRMASRHAVDIAAARSSLIALQPMNWVGIEAAITKVPLARGYRFELLDRSEINALVAAVQSWFPEISVGAASCYLREDFFRDDVYFAGAQGHAPESCVSIARNLTARTRAFFRLLFPRSRLQQT